MAKTSPTPESILKKYWGYDSFRPLQREIIDHVLQGNDALGLLPTGGGKSVIFQVAGMMLGGLTVVVTPLVSLMKDQVDNLRTRGVKAVCLHSGLTDRERHLTWERLVNGRARFLYVSPERLRNKRFLDELRNLPVSLIAVDEAHCISQWGYDFRPDYLNIASLRKIFPQVNILALTATATPQVADDICTKLDMRGRKIFSMSFRRDNISYIVRQTAEKITEIVHILNHTQGTTIIYARSRKRTKEIAEYLEAYGISATYYHAGLDFDEKERRQNAWRNDEVRVMVATNAFGMGIDKPDVRVVIHHDVPPSLEEYYQEAGRAGRDGKESYAVIIAADYDRATAHRRITWTFPDREVIRTVYEMVCNFIKVGLYEGYDTVHEFDIVKFCEIFGFQEQQVKASLRLLSQSGYLDFIEDAHNSSQVSMICERRDLYDIKMPDPLTEELLEMMMRYYTGLYTSYVDISERILALDLNISERKVYETLLTLARMKIISYRPRKRIPYIYVRTSREEPQHLVIPNSVYEDRRDNMTQRTDAMLNYVYCTGGCRVAGMLRYFGETDATACGKCDICRAHLKAAGQLTEERIAEHVISLLRHHTDGVTMAEFKRHFDLHYKLAAGALTRLTSEGIVIKHDGRYKLRWP